jgi:hypothetical protein
VAWEERNGRRYYYAKRRTPDGRVVSEYVGTGWLGDMAARTDAISRTNAETHRRRFRAAIAPVDEALAMLKRLEAELRELVTAHLVATGHRTHKGQWRKRRMFKPDVTGTVRLDLTPEEDTKATRALLKRCDTEKPKQKDVEALRAWLRSTPEPFARAFDLAELARENVLRLATGGKALAHEAARLGLEKFQASLGYEEASPLERVLIEQAATCWLVLQDVQRRYAAILAGEHRLSLAQHYEKRLSASQRRFERSLLTLERVRKLRRGGPVQINVAVAGGTFQQVNSGTDGAD